MKKFVNVPKEGDIYSLTELWLEKPICFIKRGWYLLLNINYLIKIGWLWFVSFKDKKHKSSEDGIEILKSVAASVEINMRKQLDLYFTLVYEKS